MREHLPGVTEVDPLAEISGGTGLAAPSVPSVPKGPWYISRRYATLLVGSSLSTFGDSVFEWTLALWAATTFGTGGAWLVSGVIFASAIPAILFGPIGGTLVDQWRDTVRVSVVASVLSGLIVLALLPFVLGEGDPLAIGVSGRAQMWLVLGVVAGASLVAQLLSPANTIITRDMLPPDQVERAVALGQFVRSTILMVAPALAAPIFAAFGIGWALAINGLSFFLAVVFLRLATRGMVIGGKARRDAAPVDGSVVVADAHIVGDRLRAFVADLRAGLWFAGRSPIIRTLLISASLVVVGSGIWAAVDVYFFRIQLGGSNAAYGLLGTAQGLGEIIGAFIVMRVIERLGGRRLLAVACAVLGVLSLVYAQSVSVAMAIGAVFLMGLVTSSFNIAIGPLMMRVTPREFLGRVSGTIGPVMNGSLLVGAGVGGAAVAMAGTTLTLGGLHLNVLVWLITLSGVVILLGGFVAFYGFRTAAADTEYARAAGAERDDTGVAGTAGDGDSDDTDDADSASRGRVVPVRSTP